MPWQAAHTAGGAQHRCTGGCAPPEQRVWCLLGVPEARQRGAGPRVTQQVQAGSLAGRCACLVLTTWLLQDLRSSWPENSPGFQPTEEDRFPARLGWASAVVRPRRGRQVLSLGSEGPLAPRGEAEAQKGRPTRRWGSSCIPNPWASARPGVTPQGGAPWGTVGGANCRCHRLCHPTSCALLDTLRSSFWTQGHKRCSASMKHWFAASSGVGSSQQVLTACWDERPVLGRRGRGAAEPRRNGGCCCVHRSPHCGGAWGRRGCVRTCVRACGSLWLGLGPAAGCGGSQTGPCSSAGSNQPQPPQQPLPRCLPAGNTQFHLNAFSIKP